MINSANRIFEDAEPKLYSDALRQKEETYYCNQRRVCYKYKPLPKRILNFWVMGFVKYLRIKFSFL